MNCFNDIPHFPEVKFCTIASKSHDGSSIHLKLNLVATQGKLKIFANNALTLFQDFKIVLRSQFKVLRIHSFLHK